MIRDKLFLNDCSSTKQNLTYALHFQQMQNEFKKKNGTSLSPCDIGGNCAKFSRAGGEISLFTKTQCVIFLS